MNNAIRQMNGYAKGIALCSTVVCAAAFAAPAASAAGVFVIAERGAPPQTTIWCSNAESEVEKHAAGELRDFVRCIT